MLQVDEWTKGQSRGLVGRFGLVSPGVEQEGEAGQTGAWLGRARGSGRGVALGWAGCKGRAWR